MHDTNLSRHTVINFQEINEKSCVSYFFKETHCILHVVIYIRYEVTAEMSAEIQKAGIKSLFKKI